MADEILEISDHREEDHTPFTGMNVVQRDRLRIDTRKWLLSKLEPKKYGDKVDVTSGNEPIKQNLTIIVDTSDTANTLKELRNAGSKTD
jgi:hypothetical protein